jgi:hypothetical protein
VKYPPKRRCGQEFHGLSQSDIEQPRHGNNCTYH